MWETGKNLLAVKRKEAIKKKSGASVCWNGRKPRRRVTKNDANVYNAPSPLTSLPVFLVLCTVFIGCAGFSSLHVGFL